MARRAKRRIATTSSAASPPAYPSLGPGAARRSLASGQRIATRATRSVNPHRPPVCGRQQRNAPGCRSLEANRAPALAGAWIPRATRRKPSRRLRAHDRPQKFLLRKRYTTDEQQNHCGPLMPENQFQPVLCPFIRQPSPTEPVRLHSQHQPRLAHHVQKRSPTKLPVKPPRAAGCAGSPPPAAPLTPPNRGRNTCQIAPDTNLLAGRKIHCAPAH